MLVLMVLVVNVTVLVFHGLVHMFVLMVLGKMQPNAHGHQKAGDRELRG